MKFPNFTINEISNTIYTRMRQFGTSKMEFSTITDQELNCQTSKITAEFSHCKCLSTASRSFGYACFSEQLDCHGLYLYSQSYTTQSQHFLDLCQFAPCWPVWNKTCVRRTCLAHAMFYRRTKKDGITVWLVVLTRIS